MDRKKNNVISFALYYRRRLLTNEKVALDDRRISTSGHTVSLERWTGVCVSGRGGGRISSRKRKGKIENEKQRTAALYGQPDAVLLSE